MKLQFKKNQQYQTDAVNAVADLFQGQEKTSMTFSVDKNFGGLNLSMNDYGSGNELLIDNDTLIANMHNIQRRNKLKLSSIQECLKRVESEELREELNNKQLHFQHSKLKTHENSTLHPQNSKLMKIAPQFSV